MEAAGLGPASGLTVGLRQLVWGQPVGLQWAYGVLTAARGRTPGSCGVPFSGALGGLGES